MDCIFYNGSRVDYERIYHDYHPFHGYLATVLCTFGVFMNLCNVLVLTRSDMFSTINMMLTAIAVCDTATMFSYLVYLCHFHLSSYECPLSRFTYGWAVYTVFHADLSVVLRACSLWLSVVMAALRSHILSRHQVLLLHSRYIANARLGYKLIFSTTIAVFFMSIPVFVNHSVEPVKNTYPLFVNRSDCPNVFYEVVYPSFAKQNDCLIMKLGFWTNGLLLKLIPCILLVLYLFKLIYFVQRFLELRGVQLGERNEHGNGAALKPTTFILSLILLMTLICELPNALTSLFSGVNSFAYGIFVYKALGDIFDLLALINCITSFVLYCTMSRLFRQTFVETIKNACILFKSRRLYVKWSTTCGSSTYFEAIQSEHDLKLLTNDCRTTAIKFNEEVEYKVESDFNN